MSLSQFYADRFNSDPFALLDAAHAELSDLAAFAGIDWPANAADIQLNPRGGVEKFTNYANHYPKALEKGLKGRVEIYSRREEQDGIAYPFVNFVRKGSDAGSWSGFQFLLTEYRHARQQSGVTVSVSSAEQERITRQAAARRKREEQARIQAFQTSQFREEALLGWMEFQRAFNAAPVEDGSWPYLVKKHIRDVSRHCNLKRISRHESAFFNAAPTEYLAIPLAHLDNRQDKRVVGWQRIQANGKKAQTKAVDEGDFIGACHVMGDMSNAQNVCVVEGFATGASVWLATYQNPKKRFDAVVVAISANNMIHVVEQLVNGYPGAKITCALDNDRKSAAAEKGNTGLRIGYDILEKFPTVNCVYPTFEDDPEMECSDFNDLHVLRGLKEVARQLSATTNKLGKSTDLLSMALNKLKTLRRDNRRVFAKELMRAVDIGMLTCPVPNSPQELYSTVCATLREMGIDGIYRASVKDHIARRFNRKCRAAQTPRSFSERITDPNLRPNHITYKRFDTTAVTEEVLQYVKSCEGIVIVRAGMGSGKSTGLLRPLMRSSDRGVSVAHRVSLIGGLHEMMTEKLGPKAGILHYQDDGYKALAPYANKLTVCINSIVKGCWQPLMRRHDFFGLDEATQGLRAILAGKAMDNPVGVFNTLIDSIARTEQHAMLVDADANDLLIDLAELAMRRREELGLPAWLQIHVVELPVDVKNRETGEAIRVFYTEKDRIMTEVVKAVAKGEKIMLATDSSTFAEDVTSQLKAHFPDKKFLCVNLKAKQEPEVEAFTNEPKVAVMKYDGLIYSPSISSGVSFETRHFDRHFGMFCGEVVPSDAIQMLRRDRTAREFVIGFDRVRARKEHDPQKIARAYAQALLETAAKNGELTDVIFENDRLSLGVASTTFMQLKIKAAAIEASARNDYANNMICIMHSDGYQISRLATDEIANGHGKAMRKEAREMVWEQAVELHLSTETPGNAEREQLLARHALTPEEQAKLVRWDIEHELKLEVNEASLKFYVDGARDKIRRYETMLLDEISARRRDREEAIINFNYAFKIQGQWHNFVTSAMTREQADEAFKEKYPSVIDFRVKAAPAVEVGMRSFFALKSATLQQYFRDCGIDPITMTGEADQMSLKRARDNLLVSDRRDLLNTVLRIGGFQTPKGKPKAPEALFSNICKSLGLKTDKRRARAGDKRPTIRFVDAASAEFMLEILEKRQEDGQTLQTRKAAQVTHEMDRDLDHDIEINNRSRSTTEAPDDSPASAIRRALGGLPVPVSEEWACSALSADELETVRTWSISSIALTFASLYLTEFMDRLTGSELRSMRDFISTTRQTGLSGPQEALYG